MRNKRYKKEAVISGKKRKFSIKKFSLFLLILFFISLFIYVLSFIRITNIYVSGNVLLEDQKIIDDANLSNYPSIFTLDYYIKESLKQNELIKDVVISRRGRSIYLKVFENYPIYYYTHNDETILLDGRNSKNKYLIPIVVNYIPDTIYADFKSEMMKVNHEIINRISEIRYSPDSVDEGRFLLTMNDGNYVYLTITKWNNINEYMNIIKEFPNKKGILYLNAGNSFEVRE